MVWGARGRGGGIPVQWGPSWTSLNMSVWDACMMRSSTLWVMVTLDGVVSLPWRGRHDWKHYLLATSLVGGKIVFKHVTSDSNYLMSFSNNETARKIVTRTECPRKTQFEWPSTQVYRVCISGFKYLKMIQINRNHKYSCSFLYFKKKNHVVFL